MSDYQWVVGERVMHYRDSDLVGTVRHVEENGLSVMVRWDGTDGDDFQWANKLVPAPDYGLDDPLLDPETPDDVVTAELREAGVDPDDLARRGAEFVAGLRKGQ